MIREVRYDEEGFLINMEDWSTEVAMSIAAREGLKLSEDHWLVINIAREFYEKTGVSPVMRPLVKLVRDKAGERLGSSLGLAVLFPDKPNRLVAKIGGLPKPSDCL